MIALIGLNIISIVLLIPQEKNNGMFVVNAITASVINCITVEFTCSPHWEINNVGLAVKHRLDYLGTVLSKDNGKEHASSRIKSSNQAYFSLQGAGLCQSGLAPHTSAHVYQTAVRCGLLWLLLYLYE